MTSTLRHPRNRLAMLFCLVTAAFTPGPARAWGLIYTDRADVTLPAGGGVSIVEGGFALLVNTGSTPIEIGTIYDASFELESSHPGFRFDALNFDSGFTIAPVQPGEALGSMYRSVNDVLLTRSLPGEAFRNVYPSELFAFSIDRAVGETYEGPVSCRVRVTMGGEIAQFIITCDMRLGFWNLEFPSAARTSSVPLPTPAATASWGAVRTRYR